MRMKSELDLDAFRNQSENRTLVMVFNFVDGISRLADWKAMVLGQ